jgi:hypothetical protein
MVRWKSVGLLAQGNAQIAALHWAGLFLSAHPIWFQARSPVPRGPNDEQRSGLNPIRSNWRLTRLC